MDSVKLKDVLDNNSNQLYGKAVCAVFAYGKPDFCHNINCEKNSVFDLASVSKILTGTMILMLIDKGKLSLDQTLDTVFDASLPGSLSKERFKTITVESLLTHSSGLPAWFPFYTQKGSFWNVLEIALNKYPGQEGTVYSDLGFMLLGEILCTVTGRTLQENLDELNEVLGTSFTYNPRNKDTCVETERGNRIEEGMCAERELSFDGFRTHDRNIRGEVNDGNSFYFWKGAAGHAGVFGIAEDLLALGKLHLYKGVVQGKQFISPHLIEQSVQDYGSNRGLMWGLGETFINGFGHTGFTGTSLYVCPEKNFVAVILTNRLVIIPAPDLRQFRIDAHKIIYDSI